MKAKTVITSLVLAALLALGVTAVGAQDTAPAVQPSVLRQMVEIIATETGLESAEIVAQVREGSTIADIITANGGDVEAVKAELVSVMTERINTAVAGGSMTQERADALLGNLDDLATRALNGELRRPRNANRSARADASAGVVAAATGQVVVEAVADQIGVPNAAILRQVRSGATLADIITENGGSVDNVIATAVAVATERINTAVAGGRITAEQAEVLLSNVETAVAGAVNGDLAVPLVQQTAQHLLRTAAVRQIAETTGMDAEAVVADLQAGKSAAAILTEQGVDVNTFIDGMVNTAAQRLNQQVTDGRLTQDAVDERLESLRTRLTDLLNRTFPTATSEAAPTSP
jgi:diphthamide synthase (EF-2-diphthine--ammonia ligase)